MAASESNVEVRAQLACSTKRLPADQALPIVRNLLARDEDTAEKRLPLLIWWAIESQCESNREAILGLFPDPAVWLLPLPQDHSLHRVMQRYALAAPPQGPVPQAKA